jgi:hypothetical protein
MRYLKRCSPREVYGALRADLATIDRRPPVIATTIFSPTVAVARPQQELGAAARSLREREKQPLKAPDMGLAGIRESEAPTRVGQLIAEPWFIAQRPHGVGQRLGILERHRDRDPFALGQPLGLAGRGHHNRPSDGARVVELHG